VEAVGDARSAEKDDTYAPMAEALGVRFSPFVLYTYGGFHSSALSFIKQMAAAYDPAVALVSLSEWKDDLKNRIAVCVQRHTANIMVEDARLARAAAFAKRRRGARRSSTRRRAPAAGSSVLPPRRPPKRRSLRAAGARAVSACAPLLVTSLTSSLGHSLVLDPSSPAGVDTAAETVVMEDASPEDAVREHAQSALSVLLDVSAGAGEVGTAAAAREVQAAAAAAVMTDVV
jgi:hypothetical protein